MDTVRLALSPLSAPPASAFTGTMPSAMEITPGMLKVASLDFSSGWGQKKATTRQSRR
jgi:hypothetical protein